jgi:hypothetical protein
MLGSPAQALGMKIWVAKSAMMIRHEKILGALPYVAGLPAALSSHLLCVGKLLFS